MGDMGDGDDDFYPDYEPDFEDVGGYPEVEERHDTRQGRSQAPTNRAVPKSRGMVQERFYVGEAAQLKL